ncbi:hypothetical protein H8356DRAFT_1407613 [Neocallimastix lanati (nom. inval.)]|nr:hypothetical protein H8356DRAFT_1407613 [Neocallimastix sp. JGI-2020a]
MCYFYNEEGYKKYNCPKFNHIEYLKYQRILNEEPSGSANVPNERERSPLNSNNIPEKKKYLIDAVKRKEFSLDAGTEIKKAKANTTNEEEKDEVEEENLKTSISKDSTKINDSSQNLNINNNYVINDNKLNKNEEIKNYIDKIKSNMCNDKNIGVNNKNNIIDNNIKSNKNLKSRNENNVSTKFNNNINEDKDNYIESLNESLHENIRYVEMI